MSTKKVRFITNAGGSSIDTAKVDDTNTLTRYRGEKGHILRFECSCGWEAPVEDNKNTLAQAHYDEHMNGAAVVAEATVEVELPSTETSETIELDESAASGMTFEASSDEAVENVA